MAATGIAFRDARVMAPGVSAGSVEVTHDAAADAIVGSQTTLSATTGLSFDTILMHRANW